MVKPFDAESNLNFTCLDKIVHFTLFLILGFLYITPKFDAGTLSQIILKNKSAYFLIFFTLSIEFVQLFLTYRSFDVFDIMMNVIGLISGITLGWFMGVFGA